MSDADLRQNTVLERIRESYQDNLFRLKDFLDATGYKQNEIAVILHRLVKRGILENPGRGFYKLNHSEDVALRFCKYMDDFKLQLNGDEVVFDFGVLDAEMQSFALKKEDEIIEKLNSKRCLPEYSDERYEDAPIVLINIPGFRREDLSSLDNSLTSLVNVEIVNISEILSWVKYAVFRCNKCEERIVEEQENIGRLKPPLICPNCKKTDCFRYIDEESEGVPYRVLMLNIGGDIFEAVAVDMHPDISLEYDFTATLRRKFLPKNRFGYHFHVKDAVEHIRQDYDTKQALKTMEERGQRGIMDLFQRRTEFETDEFKDNSFLRSLQDSVTVLQQGEPGTGKSIDARFGSRVMEGDYSGYIDCAGDNVSRSGVTCGIENVGGSRVLKKGVLLKARYCAAIDEIDKTQAEGLLDSLNNFLETREVIFSKIISIRKKVDSTILLGCNVADSLRDYTKSRIDLILYYNEKTELTDKELLSDAEMQELGNVLRFLRCQPVEIPDGLHGDLKKAVNELKIPRAREHIIKLTRAIARWNMNKEATTEDMSEAVKIVAVSLNNEYLEDFKFEYKDFEIQNHEKRGNNEID